jgi:hypothetical protein
MLIFTSAYWVARTGRSVPVPVESCIHKRPPIIPRIATTTYPYLVTKEVIDRALALWSYPTGRSRRRGNFGGIQAIAQPRGATALRNASDLSPPDLGEA